MNVQDSQSGTEHIRELRLRQWAAGELGSEERSTIQTHVDQCLSCQRRTQTISQEQKDFEAAMPFEPFEKGVLNAVLKSAKEKQDQDDESGWSFWKVPAAAVAALVLIGVALGPVLTSLETQSGRNHLKGGGAEVVFVVGGEGVLAQRQVLPNVPEPLAVGERVRIGYVARDNHYAAALSVDEQGIVTALYPESGTGSPISQTDSISYFPDSLEFTGTGQERVVVVLTKEPLSMESLKEAAQRAFTQSPRLDRMGELDLPVSGEQFHRTVIKPSSP